MRLLKEEAARRGCTMTELVESALRRFLQQKPQPLPLPPLPTFKSGGHLVDIANRESLYQAMKAISGRYRRQRSHRLSVGLAGA